MQATSNYSEVGSVADLRDLRLKLEALMRKAVTFQGHSQLDSATKSQANRNTVLSLKDLTYTLAELEWIAKSLETAEELWRRAVEKTAATY